MASTTATPYLIIRGQCEQAINYYREHLGAEVDMLMRFSESPDSQNCPIPEGWENRVMHCSFRIGESSIMASDGNGEDPAIAGAFIALALPAEEDVTRAFAALSQNGQVIMPPEKTFWSPLFGMVTDQFGVGWMLMVAQDCAG